MNALENLSSESLTSRIATLVRLDREQTVEMILLLAELARRDGHKALGYDSLFTYCREALRLSKGSSFRRSVGAHLLKSVPAAAKYLRDGRISLTAFCALRNVLTPDSAAEWLELATHKSKEDVEVLIAARCPRPDVRESIRPVVSHKRVAAPASVTAPPRQPEAGSAAEPQLFVAVAVSRPDRIEPLSKDRFSFQFAASKEFKAEFERAKSVFSHIAPSGSLEDVLHACMKVAVAEQTRRKTGGLRRPPRDGSTRNSRAASTSDANAGSTRNCSAAEASSASAIRSTRNRTAVDASSAAAVGSTRNRTAVDASSAAAVGSTRNRTAAESSLAAKVGSTVEPPADLFPELRSRHIPSKVKREVWARDAGRCTFVGIDGRRCGSTHMLEYEHLQPFALGGLQTAECLTLHCRSHNQFKAREIFGPRRSNS